ncbi:hypothetical protein BOW50_12525, partial [Solemya velum gill symbiont]|uniref:hypothetical protein n=1 Tax=Solemya velum gill symbiont TaxID=2340 RepID=UPI0009D5DDCA
MATSESNEAAFLRQRRNLLAFSIGILIFVLAGGDLQKASILGGSIKIDHPSVVYAFIIIGFIYTWWRYWLFAPAFMDTLKSDYYL